MNSFQLARLYGSASEPTALTWPPYEAEVSTLGDQGPIPSEETDGRALVHTRGAARDVAADDGPRDRGARPRRRGSRKSAVRGDEARVALAARPDGRGHRRPDQLRA